jgi:hypothetical protein
MAKCGRGRARLPNGFRDFSGQRSGCASGFHSPKKISPVSATMPSLPNRVADREKFRSAPVARPTGDSSLAISRSDQGRRRRVAEPGAAQEIGDRQRISNPARWEGSSVVTPQLLDWRLVPGFGGRAIGDPGDPSKLPANFVLLEWATKSSARFSLRTSTLACRVNQSFTVSDRYSCWAGACQWVSVPMYECACSKAAGMIGPFGPESMSTGAGEQA